MCRRIVAEIFVLLSLLIGITCQAYEPLTKDQALAYMIRDPQGAVADIIALDLVEHTTPDVLQPVRQYAWSGRDLVVSYLPAYLEITIGPLSYRAFLEQDVVKDFKPQTRWLAPAAIGAGVGLVIGLLTSLLAR